MIKIAPTATGIKTNSKDFAPSIAKIGFAPAGGCVVCVANIN